MPMCKNLLSAKKLSEEILTKITDELSAVFTEKEFDKSFLENVCVYACGSLARYELVKDSDLDLFFIYNTEELISNLNKYNFFSALHKASKKIGFGDPSKQGEYWDFISKKDLLDIGSRKEDYNNSLTARLLLILESKPIFNEQLYDNIVKEVIEKYFVDYEGHEGDFYPMYLINDIFRYWYTLTLNFEFRRNKNDTPNDKCWKRLKLKYARLITCFSFIACLFEKDITREKVIAIIKKTPLERLDQIVELYINQKELSSVVSEVKTKYSEFIRLRKDENPSYWEPEDNKKSAFKNADDFHNAVIRLMGEIYKLNPELKNKLDF